MDERILQTIRERGLFLEKDIYELLTGFGNFDVAREFLEKIESVSGQKMITRGVLSKNIACMRNVVEKLGENKNEVEKIFIKLGLSFEVVREINVTEGAKQNYQVFYADTRADKKLDVGDFTGHFRARFQQLQRILLQRAELQNNLVSLGKLSSDRASLSFIGIVSEKRITKNKNLMITFEDLTGSVRALIKEDNTEIFEKASELQLDDVAGVKGSGNRDFVFVRDIFFPDAFIYEKTKFNEDFNIAFLSDLHTGSNRHLEKSFLKFLEWINSDDENARKTKYLFFVGDNVDGVGIFPRQEDELKLKNMFEQYKQLAFYLRKIPSRVTMFMCPGQHDAVRVAEPQPLISKRYAPQLYEIENLVLVTNPAMIKLIEGDKEFKILMYHGASLHSLINEIKELREMKAHTCPARAVRHLLKRRHLAPTHSDVVYIPNKELDPLVISEVPDVMTTGEVHRIDVDEYHGVQVVSNSCWQAQTPFEESIGNVPDPCKVTLMNVKTREIKIFDFRDENEVDEKGVWRVK